MNPYSMCSVENKCECIDGYTKLNNTCLPGKNGWCVFRQCKTFKSDANISIITRYKILIFDKDLNCFSSLAFIQFLYNKYLNDNIILSK